MEGVPRMPMLEIELKHNSIDYSSLDWAGTPSDDAHEVVQAQIAEALKKHIRDEYGDNPDKFNDAIDKFIEIQTAAYRAILSPDFEGCNSLKKYYGQLHYMQTRFPFKGDDGLKVTFTWQDAFTGALTIQETFSFEQTSILFDIGAIHSILGASDSRMTEEGIRISCVHFQCAAGLFTYIADNFDTTLSSDISQQMLKLFINVMLAQGQECLLEKSMQDNRKHSIVSKISQQVVDYYKLCLQYLENREAENTLGSSAYKAWRRMISFKITYYSAITKYFMGNSALEQDKYGHAVSYFGGAAAHMGDLAKQAKGFPKEIRTKVDEALRFTSDVLNGKYNSSVKDNNFIYHDKVPDVATLPEVKGASLVKALPFEPANESLTGPDIFSKLVPMEAHLAASTYSEEKAKLLRTVVEKVDEKNEILGQYKNSIELDPKKLIDPNETARLDQDLVEKCASFSVDQTPISGLKQAMEDLIEVYNDLDSVLNDILTLVENEESEDLKFQEIAGKEAFSIQDDVEGIKKELSVYKELYQKASQMNHDLNTACRIHIQNMKTVAAGIDSLKEELKLTDIGKLLTEEDRSVIDLVKKLCEKVIEMEDQRTSLMQQLRQQMETDDVTSTLVTKHGIDKEDLFKEELKKYDALIDTVYKNLAAQDNILDAVTEANARYTKIRKLAANEKERVEQKSKNLVLSCEASDDVQGKCEEGKKFFGEVLMKAKELLRRAEEFQEDNQTARKKIYKKIEDKKKPPPARPSAPKPKLNTPKSPLVTTPAPGMVLSPDVLAKMMAEDDDELLNDPEFLQFLQMQGNLQDKQFGSSLPGSAPPNPRSMVGGLGPLPSRPQTMPPRSYVPDIQSPVQPNVVSSPGPLPPQNYHFTNVPSRPTPQPTPPQVMSPQPQTFVPPHMGPVQTRSLPGTAAQHYHQAQPEQMPPDPRLSPNLAQQGVASSHVPASQTYFSAQHSAPATHMPYQGQHGPQSMSSPASQFSNSLQPLGQVTAAIQQLPPQPTHMTHSIGSVTHTPAPPQQRSVGPQPNIQMQQVGPSLPMQYVPSPQPMQQNVTAAPRVAPAHPLPVPPQPTQHHVQPVVAMPQSSLTYPASQGMVSVPQQTMPVSNLEQSQPVQQDYYIPQQNAPPQRQQPIQVSQVAIVYSSQPPNRQSVATTYSLPNSSLTGPVPTPGPYPGPQYSQSDSALQVKHQPHMPNYPSPSPTLPSVANSQTHPQAQIAQYPQTVITPQSVYPVPATPPPSSVHSYPPNNSQHYSGPPHSAPQTQPQQYSTPQPQGSPYTQNLYAHRPMHPPTQTQSYSQPQFQDRNLGPARQAHPNTPLNFQTNQIPQQGIARPPLPQQHQNSGGPATGGLMHQQYLSSQSNLNQQPTMMPHQQLVRPPAPQQQQPSFPPQGSMSSQPAPRMSYQLPSQNTAGQQTYQTHLRQDISQSAPPGTSDFPQQNAVQSSPHMPSRQVAPQGGQNVQQYNMAQLGNHMQHPKAVADQPRMPHSTSEQGFGQMQPTQPGLQQPRDPGLQQSWVHPTSTVTSQQPHSQQPPTQPVPASVSHTSQMPSSTPNQPVGPQSAQPYGGPLTQPAAANLPQHQPIRPQAVQDQVSSAPSKDSYTFKSHPHPGQFMSTPSNENSPKHAPSSTQSRQLPMDAPAAKFSQVLTPTPVNAPLPEKPAPKQPSSDLAGLILTPTRSLSSSADELLFTSPEQGPVPAKNTAQVVLVPTKIDEVDEKMVVRPVEGLPYMDEADLMKFKGQVSEFKANVSNLLLKPDNHCLCELDKKWKQLSEAQEKHSRQLSTAIARCSSYKNRYQDIVPFDQSRVILKDAKDDYINASVIDGVSPYCPRFIATQSPLPNTASDFWTMVYEQQVTLIVMLVNSKDVPRKCPIYWPSDRAVPQQHGPLTVSFTTSKTHGDLYIERTFTIKHRNHSLALSVTQLQYIAWPEHRFPSSADDLLSFVSVVQSYHSSQRNLQWPVLVHCESGVGRTGVFCAFVAGINEINAGMGIMDVVEIVTKMRQKRKYMVQEKAQLKMVYDVILSHAIDVLKQRKIILYDEVKPVPTLQQPPSQPAHPQPSTRDIDIFSDLSALSSIQATVEKMTIRPGAERPPQKNSHTSPNFESKSCSDIPTSDPAHLQVKEIVRPSTSEMYYPTTSDVIQNSHQLSDLVQGTMTYPNHGYQPPVLTETPPSQPDVVESCNSQSDTNPPEPQIQLFDQFENTSASDASTSQKNLIDSLSPESFTLDSDEDASKKKQKISKEDFFKSKSGITSETDPSDPFSGLDPFWGLRK